MLAKGAVRPNDIEAMTDQFVSQIRARPSLSYITWGRETGEHLQISLDSDGVSRPSSIYAPSAATCAP